MVRCLGNIRAVWQSKLNGNRIGKEDAVYVMAQDGYFCPVWPFECPRRAVVGAMCERLFLPRDKDNGTGKKRRISSWARRHTRRCQADGAARLRISKHMSSCSTSALTTNLAAFGEE